VYGFGVFWIPVIGYTAPWNIAQPKMGTGNATSKEGRTVITRQECIGLKIEYT
jgi:hypothetical protein